MSQSHPSASSDPKVIAGRYEVEKRLGAGAMGVVYKAKDLTLRRDVAIKTIRFEGLAASQTASDELLERFKREARTAAQLKHPNIVTIYDIGDVEGLSYIAMEFIDGTGLERIILDSGKVPVQRAAALAAQVADALGFAHQHGVIHRDIKPANIMVEPGERVKVTDFGIAKPMDAAENLTATGGLLGTPSYMSPEQARGQKIDGRSDLFSVGCLLYEMVTGRKAFSGDNITAILFKIIQEEPAPVRELNPLVPEELTRIVDRALAKSPDARHQTGRELADELLALTHPGHVPTVRETDVPTSPVGAGGGTPTIATPPTAKGTSPPSPATTPATMPDGGATVPVPPTELLATSPPVRPSPPPPEPPTAAARTRRPQALPRRRKTGGGLRRWVGVGAAAVLLLALLATGTWWAFGRRRPAPTPTTEGGVSTESATATTPTTPAAAPASDAGASAPPVAPASDAAATATPTPPPPAPPPRASSAPARAAGAAPPVPAGPTTRTDTPSAPPAAAPPRPVPDEPAATAAAPSLPPAGEDFLDRLPEEAPDGRAAGNALAEQYRSGGGSTSFGATGRYNRRPRIPPHAPPERPAVRALAWILSAEQAHLARAGRYGTLSELVEAGDLPLGGGWTADGFTRRQYRFTVSAAGDRFRAEARPLAGGRAFYVDEAGYVLVAD
ncbi:MAG: protein kinase [Acidobacteria bacterium]|nr:protein kinase [Acidobacteriota bacterium]